MNIDNDNTFISKQRKNNLFSVNCYEDSSDYQVKVIKDDKLLKKANTKIKYKFNIKNTNVILGSSMSGKTTIFLHLYKTHLQHKYKIENTYIISSTVNFNDSMKPIVDLMEQYDKKEELEDEDGLLYNNVVDEWNPAIREYFEDLYQQNMKLAVSERENILLIFDDVTNIIPSLKSGMRSKNEDNKFFDRLCCQGRHNNFATWYLLHEYYNNIIHKNATLYFLCNSPQIEKVLNNTLRSVSKVDAEDVWRFTLKRSKFPFIVVDVTGKNDSYKQPSIYSMLDKAIIITSKNVNIKSIKKDYFIENIKNFTH